MKRIWATILTVCIFALSISCVFGLTPAAATLSDEEIAAKNLPIPKGYKVDTILTFDSAEECTGEVSTDEGTYYDTASNKMTLTGYWREHSAFKTMIPLTGTGFMFWYKSENACVLRLRTQDNGLPMEATLPACPDGQWITYYYYGKCVNFTFKTDISSDIRKTIANTSNTYKINIISVSGNEFYIDEFYTFSPILTPADTYDNDGQAFKFSLNRFNKTSNAVADYSDDGSVTLSSTYGETTNSSPVEIYYNMDVDQFKKAVDIANAEGGSGYLQIKVDNISCHNSSGADDYAQLSLTMAGIDKSLIKYSYGSGTSDTYLIKVSDITDVSALTTLCVKITGSNIKDVQFKFSPITVFHFPEDELILQAEDMNSQHKLQNGNVEATPTYTDNDKNRTYVYGNSTDQWVSYDLPKLEVGEYEVYASCYVIKNTKVKVNVSVNNRRQLVDVAFSDETYTSYKHNVDIPIGKLTITKNYSDGASVIKFSSIQYCSTEIYIDYFSLKKTDTDVTAEPSSNFEIKDYPEMEDYEVKTVLRTYDDYICGSDVRWYKTQQVSGYIGDGTAFNLNSCATIGGGFDNNYIYYGYDVGLDGNGLRFWYKGDQKMWLRFNGTGVTRFSHEVAANPGGGWVTIYYSDLVSDGDMSAYSRIELIGGKDCYIDELHTIWEKEGDLVYELNGDGTASVVGFNLRLENVTVADTYKGCPVVSIKDNACAGSLTLKSITLPDSVKSIGEGAFDGCLNLRSVNLENVTTIADGAFNNCEKLTDITLNADTTNISGDAFTECDALYINVTNDSQPKAYAIANTYDYICKTDAGLIYYREFNETGSNTSIIGYDGESDTVNVPVVIDSSVVRTVDIGAFKGNTAIKSVTLPVTLETVKNEAFSGCTALESVSMTQIATIADGAFSGCTSLKTVTVGNSLKTVGDDAFYNCSALESFYFGDSITSIGDDAFYNCTPVAVMSDSTYTSKSGYSYTYVNNAEFKYYPDNDATFDYYVVKYIATISGYKSNNPVVEIPSTIDTYDVKNVDKGAFRDNSVITTVKFNENMRNIYDSAFYNCANLSSVTYPDSLRKITDYAFASCPKLLSVTLTNVVVIADTAFDSTTKINYEQTNFMRDAFDYVDGMTAGWNLGNTLDAHSHSYSYGDITVDQSEHLWRKENFITSDLFDLVVEDFNTIRIPITWNAFINPDNDYAIDEDYMDRIQEVVDMCYKAGFEYIIINTHHDSDYYFNPNPDNDLELGKYVLKRVWEQIGERFADYDEKLIFESMNEIRSMALDWSWSNWSGNSSLLETYNEFNKVFYSTVRNTGGNNGERYLMLQTYGGMRDSGHFKGLWLPDKSDDDHIIASFHWYIESQTVAHYTGILNFAKNYWIDKGIPCVIGETGIPAYYINGVLEKYDDEWRENWVNVAFGLFEEYNIKAIVWDDHGTYSNTYYDSNGKIAWKFPKYVAAIKAITAKQGSSGGEQDTTASSTETSTEPTTQTTTATTTTTTTVTSTTVTTTQPTSTVTTTQTTTATTTATATSTQPTTTERKFIYGDTNADGVINTKDVLLLRKHLAKWDVTIDADAADCNADGKVNTKDLLLLRKYLARWDVFLGKA